jgi:hypothetical protein
MFVPQFLFLIQKGPLSIKAKKHESSQIFYVMKFGMIHVFWLLY